MKPLQMEEEVTSCGDIHELQLSLLLVFLDHLVAGSNQDIVLLLLVEEDRDDDVFLVLIQLDPHESFEGYSPFEILEVHGLTFFVGEACFDIHHPHKGQDNETFLHHEELVLF